MPPWSADPCHVCSTPTTGRVEVGDGRAAICSDACTTAFAHELKVVAAVDHWLAAIPSEYEHGDPIHGTGAVLDQFRRGEWRTRSQDEPTGVSNAPEIPESVADEGSTRSPGMGARSVSSVRSGPQGGATEDTELDVLRLVAGAAEELLDNSLHEQLVGDALLNGHLIAWHQLRARGAKEEALKLAQVTRDELRKGTDDEEQRARGVRRVSGRSEMADAVERAAGRDAGEVGSPRERDHDDVGRARAGGVVDLVKATEAALRLIDVAFRKHDELGPIRPRFSIPRREDDDDAIIMAALRELERLRAAAPVSGGSHA